MSRLGLNAKLYRNTGTYGTPTWTEVTNVVDSSVGDEMEAADVSTRGSGGFKEEEPTLRAVSLSFQMVNKAGNADLIALRTAYAGRTSIDMVALDGPIATAGSNGVRAHYKVFSFARSENLREAQMIDVSLRPCSAAEAPTMMTIE